MQVQPQLDEQVLDTAINAQWAFEFANDNVEALIARLRVVNAITVFNLMVQEREDSYLRG